MNKLTTEKSVTKEEDVRKRSTRSLSVDALQQVTCQFRIEKAHRQLHQFDQKVRHEADIYSRADMQQNPASNKFHTHLADKKHKLCNQNQVNEIDIARHHSLVDDGLH